MTLSTRRAIEMSIFIKGNLLKPPFRVAIVNSIAEPAVVNGIDNRRDAWVAAQPASMRGFRQRTKALALSGKANTTRLWARIRDQIASKAF
jgi:hypothetical protein